MKGPAFVRLLFPVVTRGNMITPASGSNVEAEEGEEAERPRVLMIAPLANELKVSTENGAPPRLNKARDRSRWLLS